MDGRILEMSVFADGILKKCGVGSVHSVYRKTVNLSLGEAMLSLQPRGAVRSPLGLITDFSETDFAFLEIRPGDMVRIEKTGILAGRMRFHAEGAVLREYTVPGPLPPQRRLCLERKLREMLYREKNGIFCQMLSGQYKMETELLARVSKRQLENARNQAEQREWKQAARSLCRLVGLGIGLTPGGDDFLCGVLAGTELGAQKSHPFTEALKLEIRRNLGRTNDISRAFLACALEGQYGQLAHSFYEKSAEEIFSEAERIGHSSGMDTLCGIVYCFGLMKDLQKI